MLFFKEEKLENFKHMLEEYCTSMAHHDFSLTHEEMIQLSWYMTNSYITPEARGKDATDVLHFEIKRGMTRLYCFELLLRGDDVAYQEFTQSQRKEIILSHAAFKRLSDEAISLDDNIKAVIKKSCLLTINDQAKVVLKSHGHTLSNDSEEFLTQVVPIIQANKLIFPITSSLTERENDLLIYLYWPNMHLRHMIYTEGSEAMIKSFREGIVQKLFSLEHFLIWKWRWLTNLFGFQSGPGAKYFDSETYQLSTLVFDELDLIIKNPDHKFLENYLYKRAELAGFMRAEYELTSQETFFIAHLATAINQVNVLSPELGEQIYQGYKNYLEEWPDSKLVSQYEGFMHNHDALTPTYIPAMFNNAYLLFKNKLMMNNLDALRHATQFMCQFLSVVYCLSFDKKISCMNLAKEHTLLPLVEQWFSNHRSVSFEISDTNEMMAEVWEYYNIALLPKIKSPIFIKLSQEFSCSSDFILGENSLPHITLVQFCLPKNYSIEALWQRIEDVVTMRSLAEIAIELTDTKAKVQDKSVWLQLQATPNPACYQLHTLLVNILKEFNVTPLNACLENYDPHLTLSHCKDLSLIEKLKRIEANFLDEYNVALGVADKCWQFKNVIRTVEPAVSLVLKV